MGTTISNKKKRKKKVVVWLQQYNLEIKHIVLVSFFGGTPFGEASVTRC